MDGWRCPASALVGRSGPSAAVVLPSGDVRGMLLDVDDTLLGTREAMVCAGREAARTLWPDADPALLAVAGVRFRDDPSGHFRAFTRGELDFATMRALRVRDLSRWLGQEPRTEDAGAWNDAFEAEFAHLLRPFDDVVTTLRACRDRGWSTVLLTNSSTAYTRRKLGLAGLGDAVAELSAGVVTKDTLGVGKPAAEVFHHACALMGREPGEVVHVGDELDMDTCGALAAGLGAAWIRRPGYGQEQAHVEHAAAHGLRAVEMLAEVLEPSA